MTFQFPTTGEEFMIMLVPLVTLLLGLAFLLVPGRLLSYMGLRARPDKPEAIGEGRSSFAGPLLAVALCCLLLQEPIALQPGLNFVLALGWTFAALGRVLQMVFDGGWRKRIRVRFALAVALAILAWVHADIPTFWCFETGLVNCYSPQSTFEWLLYMVALLTLVLGLVALFLPKLALRILRLESRMRYPFGVGEPRGTLAGFYTSLGLTVLLMPQPLDFVALMLGAAWLLTGVGRALSMVVDRGFTPYNIAGMVFELGIGTALLGMMFRIF
ncbi:MAG: hypothetical protein QNJ29_09345 [Rhizobiaceae bacterium]|nr:hypothetical protein [Rhizobiaceae bacterium]